MRQKNKWGFRKINWLYVCVIFLFVVILGYYIAAGAEEGITIFDWFENIQVVAASPFKNYWNKYTLPVMGVFCVAYFLWLLLYLTSAKNYMRGREFGTSHFGDPKDINKKFADLKHDVKDDKNVVVEQKRVLLHPKTVIVNTRNRMISQNIQMTLDTTHTDLNDNILLFGGSGAGKTFRFALPNLMMMSSSFVITDPKGEIMRKSAGFLKEHGYEIRVLNLLDAKGMKKSSRYNPFCYVTNDTDIEKMVTTFMESTKKKGASSGEQFWEDMAGLLLQGLFFYVHDKGVEIDGKIHHDFMGVMHLVNMLKVEEDPSTGQRARTKIDQLFADLEAEKPSHRAVLDYNKAMVGAADTVRSIISTVNSRTRSLQSKEILELFSDDEMDIKTIGARKTAVFCIIPDNDKTFNYAVSILYQQMFQQLYYQADFVYGGSLPVHVTFLLDEFANVALPDDFCSLLSTMRSRGISAIIIIQNMAQIKALFKDTWETIPGNCDTLIYLGGNEQSTHEYLSKMLGDETIDKQTQGVTKGKQGSTSRNEDVLGRKLMLPDEVRKMSRKQCLVIISGQDPVIDKKIQTLRHPLWKEFVRLSKKYDFDGRLERLGKGNIVVKGEDDEVQNIKLIGKTQVDTLRAEDERNWKEYEEEKRVAQLTGAEVPEPPKKRVIDVSLEELLMMALEQSPEDETLAVMVKEFQEASEESLEEFIEDALYECYDEGENGLRYYEMIEDDDETEEEEETQDAEQKNVEKKNPEKKAEVFKELLALGYTAEQMKVIFPLTEVFTVERIFNMFAPDMDVATMLLMAELLKDS